MNIDEIKRFLEYIVRKNNSALLDPSQFNLIMDRAQMSKFMELFGNPKEYKPNDPTPRVAYEVSQKISDDLRLFKENKDIILSKDGKAAIPDDYIHLIAITNTTAENTENGIKKIHNTVDVVNEDKETYRLGSRIVPPTREYPIAVLKKDHIQVHPDGLTNIVLSYLRRPKAPIWGFDVSNNRPVYSASKSVDLEWPEQTINDIIIRACNFVGISIKDSDIIGYTESKTIQGL